jgi:filamentous hemagglutinin
VLNYAKGIGSGIADTLGHPIDTLINGATSLYNTITDSQGTATKLQNNARVVVEQAGNGNFTPAGQQVGQQIGGTVVGTAIGIGVSTAVGAIDGAVSNLRGGLAAGDVAVTPPRVSNGIVLDSRLPDPVAGLEYTPKTLNSPNPNIANSQVNGYVGELKLANEVASIPNQKVVQYGGAVGTHGADVVSVNSVTGEVTLWDNKFLSNVRNVPPSTTFAPQSSALDGTLTNARNAIDSSNLSPVIKQQAIQNLEKRNFTTNTVESGAAKNSTIVRFCSGNPC